MSLCNSSHGFSPLTQMGCFLPSFLSFCYEIWHGNPSSNSIFEVTLCCSVPASLLILTTFRCVLTLPSDDTFACFLVIAIHEFITRTLHTTKLKWTAKPGFCITSLAPWMCFQSLPINLMKKIVRLHIHNTRYCTDRTIGFYSMQVNREPHKWSGPHAFDVCVRIFGFPKL